MPKISIILSSYNHEKYIADAIENALSQTFSDFELIIVDDCSTDRSWEIIQSFDDPRIKKIRHEKNMILSVPVTISLCNGEYIAVHHSDDLWVSDKLEKQVAFMDAYPEISACFTQVELIDEIGNPAEISESHIYHDVFEQQNRDRLMWLQYFFNKGNCLCHPSILIRKESYEKYNLKVFNYSQIPDFVMWIRLCMHSDIHILQEKLTKFRIRDAEKNTSGDRPDTRIRSAIEYYFMLREFLNLKDKDEFLTVFPEAMEYLVDGQIMTDYALARICLNNQSPESYQLFGLEVLFTILSDPKKRKTAEKLYGFSKKQFYIETGKFDVFHKLSPERTQLATLHIDYGSGFDAGISLQKNGYLPAGGAFEVKFEVPEGLNGESPVNIRFDPYEGQSVCCRLITVVLDGKPLEFSPVNAVKRNDLGFDLFLTTDPMYYITPTKPGELTIKGNVEILDPFTIAEEYERLQSNFAEKARVLNFTSLDLKDLKTNYDVMSRRLETAYKSNKICETAAARLQDEVKQLKDMYDEASLSLNEKTLALIHSEDSLLKANTSLNSVTSALEVSQTELAAISMKFDKALLELDETKTELAQSQRRYEEAKLRYEETNLRYEETNLRYEETKLRYEETIDEKNNVQEELYAIKSSRWWAIATKYYRMMSFIKNRK